MTSSSGMFGDLAHDVRAGDALPVDDAAQPAVPGGQHEPVAERAEIEVARPRRDRESGHRSTPARPARRTAGSRAAPSPAASACRRARCPSRRTACLAIVDLPAAMDALIFAMADDVALRPWRQPVISSMLRRRTSLERLAGQRHGYARAGCSSTTAPAWRPR